MTTVTRPTDPLTGAPGWHGHNPRRQGEAEGDDPVADLPPTIGNLPGGPLSMLVGLAAALPDITVDDPENAALTVRVWASNGVIGGLPHDPNYDPDAPFYLITGTEAEVNAALAAATFTARSADAGTISIVAGDGTNVTDPVEIQVMGVNEEPVISGVPSDILYLPVGRATALPAITVDDPENGTLTVRLNVYNGTLDGLSVNPVTEDGVDVYTLTGTEGEINGQLAGITYTPDGVWTGAVSISVEDQGGATAQASVTVIGRDDPPLLNGLPEGSLTMPVGTPRPLPGITVDDPEDGVLKVNVSSRWGRIDGLPPDPAAGPGEFAYVLTGTEAEINAALSAATYTATAAGADQLYIVVHDGGMHAPAYAYIDVNATNGAPTLAGIPEDVLEMPVGVATALPDITVDDPEGGILTVRLSATNGVVNGLPHDPNYDPEAPFYLVTGTKQEIDTALADATFTVSGAGAASIEIIATDGRDSSGPSTIQIAATYGTPTVSGVPESYLLARVGVETALPDFTVDDPEDGVLSLRLCADNGTIGGLSFAPVMENGVAVYTLTGTEAEINAVLADATFTGASEGWGYVNFSVEDQGGAIAGANVALLTANQAPVIGGLPTEPATVRAGVASALPDFTVDDFEDGLLTVRLTAQGGTIDGLPADPAGGASYLLTGTEAEVNAQLAAATYTALGEGWNAITISAEDDHGLVGTAEFNFTSINEAPVIGGLPAGPLPMPVGKATALPAITVDDPEDGVLRVEVQAINGSIAGLERFPGIDPSLNIYLLTGTEGDINAQLAAATYTAADEGYGALQIGVWDSLGSSAGVVIELTGTDEAPALTLPSAPLSVTAGAVVALPAITVDDPEDGPLTLEVYGGYNLIHGLEDVGSGYGSSVYRVTGTEGEINAALSAAVFTAPEEGASQIQIVVGDGRHTTTATLEVNAAPAAAVDETLTGTALGDLLSAGGGDDVLIGGGGDDVLVGGTGADVFVFGAGAGHDRIMDFRAYEGDRIAVTSDLTYTVTENSSGYAAVGFSDGSSVLLSNVFRSDVTAACFIAA